MVKAVCGASIKEHFGEDKTYLMAKENYYWPHMLKDTQDNVKRCSTCQVAKSHSLSHGLYTPLPIPQGLWLDVSMDFLLGLPRNSMQQRLNHGGGGLISLDGTFPPCHKANDVSYVACLYFKEVVRLHGIPLFIMFDCDSKFLSHFCDGALASLIWMSKLVKVIHIC